MNSEQKKYTYFDSPIGRILLVGNSTALSHIHFVDGRHPLEPGVDWQIDEEPFHEAIAQLQAYFEGNLKTFALPLQLEGTDFQIEVWHALQEIPYGKTVSYADIAKRISRPKAVRAVGAANGQNPIAIIVPCHRVIGSNGSLTGYGGGLKNKEALLALEQGRIASLVTQQSLFE